MLNRVTAVVLAGGKGTRSANPELAKVLQVVEGKTLLEYHLDLLGSSSIGSVVVVTGHFGDQVESYVREIDQPHGLSVFQEIESVGTVNALKNGMTVGESDAALVILGDILCSFDVDLFLKAWEESGKNVGVVAHPSMHPQDSDLVFTSFDDSVTVKSKYDDKSGVPNMASTGVFAVRRIAFADYEDCVDIGADLIRRAASVGDLFVWVDSRYFKDTGTPERLDGAKSDVASGVFRRRGKLQARSALFLDRDGILNRSIPEVYSVDEYQLIPEVAHEVAQFNASGIPVFIVTNQPGIAKGFMSFEEHECIRAEMDRQASEFGAFFDEYVFCPHHPDRGFRGEVEKYKIVCECRKPAPGMALDLADRHGIALHDSAMVGDTFRDFEMAKAAGMRFHHAPEGECVITQDHHCFNSPAAAIEALREYLSR